MALETLSGWARELLGSERVARLAYLDRDGRPRVLPVTFAVAGDCVWSAIDEKPKRVPEPARVGALRERPEAALLVDVYDDDWSRLAWVQLLGRVEVVPVSGAGVTGAEAAAAADAADPDTADALASLAARYSQYAERTPPGPLLRLRVERALEWRASG